ncbi:MAG: NAD-dependent epimerase/dehydratase family protein [Thalassovita sp.]
MDRLARGHGTSRILILGATSKVGRFLRAIWGDTPPHGCELIYQTRHVVKTRGQVHYDYGDDPFVFGKLDTVISLWGNTSSDLKALEDNTRLALDAIRIARVCGADRVFHASSIAAYGPRSHPLSEQDTLAPANAYGKAKAAMEAAVQDATPPKSCCLRLGSIAGAESLAKAFAANATLTLDRFADSKGPSRSYIAPSDLADILIQLATLPLEALPPALNIGASNPVQMAQLLRAAGADFAWRPAPDTALQNAVLDTSALQHLISMPPRSADPDWIAQDWIRWKGPADDLV